LLNDTTPELSLGQTPCTDFQGQEPGLRRLGLTDTLVAHWHQQKRKEGGLARVLSVQRGRWLLAGNFPGGSPTDGRERGLEASLSTAVLSGRLLDTGELPVTGDWVTLRSQGIGLPGSEGLEIIDGILPRSSWLAREAAGGNGAEQLLAANVDLVLCVMALGQNYNLSRMERYLSLAWESGAQPVIVITKVDTAEMDAALPVELEAIAQGVPCLFCSGVTGQGLDGLAALLHPGRTAVLIGSSGAGKSTLLNALSGQALMTTGAISDAVGKGRHTTVSRELFGLASGALIIDTPGMRELALICEDASVNATFAEMETLSGQCRFADCRHSGEPGCAVQTAVEDGSMVAESRAGTSSSATWNGSSRWRTAWSEKPAPEGERAPGAWTCPRTSIWVEWGVSRIHWDPSCC
jgi:ribosome biogenesis GTPase